MVCFIERLWELAAKLHPIYACGGVECRGTFHTSAYYIRLPSSLHQVLLVASVGAPSTIFFGTRRSQTGDVVNNNISDLSPANHSGA